MLKAKDLRDQSFEELEASLLDVKKGLYELKSELKQAKKLEKPHMLRDCKKDIAKILTVITEKQSTKS